jgi:hypothetical protein
MEKLVQPALERDRPGPTDTAEFVRGFASQIDVLPDELGIRKLDRALGRVAMGPVSLGIGERPPRLVPCAVDVTRDIKDAQVMDEPKVMLLWWSAFFWDANRPREEYITRACNAVMSDPAFWDRLREYGVINGSFTDSKPLTRFAGKSTSVTEDEIRNLLDDWFKANNLPVDEQTVYIVMLPGGTTSQYDTSNGYGGHHQTYRSGGAQVT